MLCFKSERTGFHREVMPIMMGTTPDVVAIHDVELLPGQDAHEFEMHVLNTIAPIYNKMEGTGIYLS